MPLMINLVFFHADRWNSWNWGNSVGSVKNKFPAGSQIIKCWSLPDDRLRHFAVLNGGRWYCWRSEA